MKIGELAKHVGCSVETIRYYEHEHLLHKPLRNSQNNYREYDATHLERLHFICRCRSLGMTHEEIRVLLSARESTRNCQVVNDLVEGHLQHVQKRIEELQALESELNTLRAQCQGIHNTDECGILLELDKSEQNTTSARDIIHSSHVCGHK
ncbi:Cd(II)/Pb(II)-responsive transcriptional regulator [Acinetobacter sp. MD2(2019)]|uniref:Cd(II)/Pb(II)-responsive transcriptional regulator n=1 Tax=Acinetobacter sp. MD2(2019) TaxID=2605273 RepID=UPI002D1F27B6|nr:Cd(II)/Pb(II)-responsive transcriptional regulator [Acinetobacter sp. MD2(2019)]MEB3754582.1 Cd(II)/Pb(II)-responsive transcriptional regulator [Acinetobacter sp. MD2(2019)]